MLARARNLLAMAVTLAGPGAALAGSTRAHDASTGRVARDGPAPGGGPLTLAALDQPAIIPLLASEQRFRVTDAQRLIEVLREALFNGTPRQRVDLIQGLAALKDPLLRPLFVQLSDAPWSEVRIQAILAAAALDPARGIDLLAVQRLRDRDEQTTIIVQAVMLDLLAPGQLEDLARWSRLDDRLTVSIAGLLTESGTPPPPQRVRAVMDDAQAGPELRLHAALVLMEQGDQTVEPLARDLLAQLLALPGAKGDEAISSVLSRIKRQRLRSAVPTLLAIRAHPTVSPLVRFEALGAMIAAAPDAPEVIDAVTKELDYKGETPADRLAHRVRIALALLDPVADRPTQITPELYAGLAGSPEALLKSIVGVLDAVSSNGDMTAAVTSLAAQRHAPSSAWALQYAQRRPWQEAQAIRREISRGLLGASSEPVVLMGMRAAMELCNDDPALVRDLLQEALQKGDRTACAAILSGALRSSNADAVQLAILPTPAARWPDAQCEALADLVLARHGSVDLDVVPSPQRLGGIATGDGNLPTVYRLQAAWIALKAQDQERAALANLLTAAQAPTPAP